MDGGKVTNKTGSDKVSKLLLQSFFYRKQMDFLVQTAFNIAQRSELISHRVSEVIGI